MFLKVIAQPTCYIVAIIIMIIILKPPHERYNDLFIL